MGPNALSPLATLTLTWLLPRKGARGPYNTLERRLRPFFEHRSSGAAWAEAFEGELRRLASRGLLSTEEKTIALSAEGRELALELLGLRRLPPQADFDDLYKKYLVPSVAARRYGASLSASELAALGDAKKLGAFATASARGLRLKAPVPTRTQLRSALVWQALGLERHDEVSLPKLVQVLLSRLAGADHARNAEQALDRLVAQALGARRTGPDEVRAAVVRAWVDAEEQAASTHIEAVPASASTGEAPRRTQAPARHKASQPEARPRKGAERESSEPSAANLRRDGHDALPLAEFAARVVHEAQRAQEGRFGERKVFIAHLSQRLAPSFNLDEAAFKAKLVESHRAGLLTLSRADLVGAMPPEAVAASETSYQGATFHFVVAEPAPAP